MGPQAYLQGIDDGDRRLPRRIIRSHDTEQRQRQPFKTRGHLFTPRHPVIIVTRSAVTYPKLRPRPIRLNELHIRQSSHYGGTGQYPPIRPFHSQFLTSLT